MGQNISRLSQAWPKKIKNCFIVQNDFKWIQLEFATNKINIDSLERALEPFEGSKRGEGLV